MPGFPRNTTGYTIISVLFLHLGENHALVLAFSLRKCSLAVFLDDPPREGGKERPRLQLQKRTKPIEEAGKVSNKSASIFGGAKPVDTAAKEREIEERLNRQKEMENEQQEKENRHRSVKLL